MTPDDTFLGLLAYHEQHGYQLLDVFRDPSQLGCVWALSVSQLYAVLKRLDSQTYITGREVASQDAPTRTVYAISPLGADRLYTWLNEPSPSASIRNVRVEFLSRLYVARLLNQPTLSITRRQKEACRSKRDALVKQRNAMAGGIGFLSLDLQIEQLSTILEWIDRCELSPHSMEDL